MRIGAAITASQYGYDNVQFQSVGLFFYRLESLLLCYCSIEELSLRGLKGRGNLKPTKDRDCFASLAMTVRQITSNRALIKFFLLK